MASESDDKTNFFLTGRRLRLPVDGGVRLAEGVGCLFACSFVEPDVTGVPRGLLAFGISAFLLGEYRSTGFRFRGLVAPGDGGPRPGPLIFGPRVFFGARPVISSYTLQPARHFFTMAASTLLVPETVTAKGNH